MKLLRILFELFESIADLWRWEKFWSKQVRALEKWTPPVSLMHAVWVVENIEEGVFPPDNKGVLACVLLVLYLNGKRDKAVKVLRHLVKLEEEA